MIDFEEDAKNLKGVLEALQEIAAAAKESRKWLVVGGRNYRVMKLKQIDIDKLSGRVYIQNNEDDTAYVHQSEEWASRRLMTTMEVMGL